MISPPVTGPMLSFLTGSGVSVWSHVLSRGCLLTGDVPISGCWGGMVSAYYGVPISGCVPTRRVRLLLGIGVCLLGGGAYL